MSTSRTYVAGAVLTAAQQNDLAQGTLGYAPVTANQTGIGAGPTDLTGFSVTVTMVAGRRIKVTGHARMLTQTAVAVYTVDIQEGATVLGEIGITSGLAIGERAFADGSVILQPTAGAHTYKLTATRASGTGTLNIEHAAAQPGFILVEDIGI